MLFDTTGFNLNRFKADVYGQANIEKLKKEELNATPDKMIEDMSNEKRFGLINEEKPYTKEENWKNTEYQKLIPKKKPWIFLKSAIFFLRIALKNMFL